MYSRSLSFVATLFLCAVMVSNAWATDAEDDCFFNWVEPQYPTFIAPAGAQSQFLSPYYYRYYSITNSYLGISSADQHLYYLASNGEMLDLGLYGPWLAQSGCQATSTGSREDVANMLDQVFGLSETVTDSGLTDQMEPLLMAFLGYPSTCPAVSTNLDLASLDISDPNLLTNLPNPITAQISYPNCQPIPDGPLMSGAASMTVRGLSVNPTTGLLSVQFELAANQLKENGTLLANGAIAGSLNLNMNNLTGSATINLDNFQTTTGGATNGTATLTISSATSFLMSIDINDGANLAADLKLSMSSDGDSTDRFIINTTGPGTINQYTVVFRDIVFDSAVCADFPVGGSALFSSAGESWTATFDSRCNGSYLLQ